jgi:phosphoribosylanthranilate isomerase
MMVKICGITNREDALAAIDGGASALGFNFYPRSPRYVDPALAAELIPQLPATIWKVGVFVQETPERIAEIARRVGLDVVQLHWAGQPARLPHMRVWQTAHVDENFRLADLDQYPVEAVLLDTPAGEAYGGTGRTFDWSKAAGETKVKIILAGGLDAGNVRQAIAAAHPWGVDVCSRIEASPGRKDHVKMAQFLREATA